MELHPALYLLPVGISDALPSDVLPAATLDTVLALRHLIVENVRTARRFLKRCSRDADIAAITFHELNEHTRPEDVSPMLDALRRGQPMGIMSEAGCPGVADPGAAAVAIAQSEGYEVVPMVGPSSILLALMASGFNGQRFCFTGYLPVDDAARRQTLRSLEADSARTSTTYIFIETPYRNVRLLTCMAETLRPDTLVCVASDITDPERQRIVTRPAAWWRKHAEGLDKHPAVFLIHRQ